MGYRGDLRITVTKGGFEDLKTVLNENEKAINYLEHLDVQREVNEQILFGWNEIKWGDEIYAIKKGLDTINDHYNRAYNLVWMGEELEDIEEYSAMYTSQEDITPASYAIVKKFNDDLWVDYAR